MREAQASIVVSLCQADRVFLDHEYVMWGIDGTRMRGAAAEGERQVRTYRGPER